MYLDSDEVLLEKGGDPIKSSVWTLERSLGQVLNVEIIRSDLCNVLFLNHLFPSEMVHPPPAIPPPPKKKVDKAKHRQE